MSVSNSCEDGDMRQLSDSDSESDVDVIAD